MCLNARHCERSIAKMKTVKTFGYVILACSINQIVGCHPVAYNEKNWLGLDGAQRDQMAGVSQSLYAQQAADDAKRRAISNKAIDDQNRANAERQVRICVEQANRANPTNPDINSCFRY